MDWVTSLHDVREVHREVAIVTGTERVAAAGLGLPPGVGSPFRPDQKVKLDKSEARRGAFSCVTDFWAMTGTGTPLRCNRSIVIIAGGRLEVCDAWSARL